MIALSLHPGGIMPNGADTPVGKYRRVTPWAPDRLRREHSQICWYSDWRNI
jgi:hypothetical protein